MSLKFEKGRSVNWKYLHIPMMYCGEVPNTNKNKNFVLIDDLGKHYVASWRNCDTCRTGMTFLVKKVFKKGKFGFEYKGKFYKLGNTGWVI